jgi:uncharacterized delta-60 repeat protein
MKACRHTAIGLLLFATAASAGPPLEGTLDPGFGTGGLASAAFGLSNQVVDRTAGVAVSPSGRIYLAATVGVVHQGSHFERLGLVRFLAGGQLDSAFSSDGLASPTPTALATQHVSAAGVVVRADGKPLVYGSRVAQGDVVSKSVICRYAVAGNLDPTYDIDGCAEPTMAIIDNGVEQPVTALGMPDERLLLAGVATTNPGNPNETQGFLLMLDAGGSVDPGFAGNGRLLLRPPGTLSALVSDLLRLADGRLLAIGTADDRMFAARVLPGGVLDASFGNNGYVTISFDDQHNLAMARTSAAALAVDSIGRLYLCGQIRSSAPQQSLMAFARLVPNGLLDLSFAGDGRVVRPLIDVLPISRVRDCAVDAQDRLVAAVEAGTVNNSDFGALRLLPDGTPDPRFNLSGQAHHPINLGGGGIGHDPVAALALVGEFVLIAGTSYAVDSNSNPSVGEVHTMIRLGPDRPFADGFEGP